MLNPHYARGQLGMAALPRLTVDMSELAHRLHAFLSQYVRLVDLVRRIAARVRAGAGVIAGRHVVVLLISALNGQIRERSGHLGGRQLQPHLLQNVGLAASLLEQLVRRGWYDRQCVRASLQLLQSCVLLLQSFLFLEQFLMAMLEFLFAFLGAVLRVDALAATAVAGRNRGVFNFCGGVHLKVGTNVSGKRLGLVGIL